MLGLCFNSRCAWFAWSLVLLPLALMCAACRSSRSVVSSSRMDACWLQSVLESDSLILRFEEITGLMPPISDTPTPPDTVLKCSGRLPDMPKSIHEYTYPAHQVRRGTVTVSRIHTAHVDTKVHFSANDTTTATASAGVPKSKFVSSIRFSGILVAVVVIVFFFLCYVRRSP